MAFAKNMVVCLFLASAVEIRASASIYCEQFGLALSLAIFGHRLDKL